MKRVVVMAVGALLIGARSAGAQERCTGNDRALRRAAVTTTVVGANTAMYVYFKNAWWAGEKRSFWFNNDWDLVFRDQDKLGHLYGGYQLTRAGATLLRWACVSPSKAVFWSAAHATAFQMQIEIWDAQQKLYGFSMPDVLFNTLGAAYGVGQHHSRTLAAIVPTVSYHRTRARKLARGGNADLRLTTDYSGQTYWLSTNPDDLLPERAARMWPGILRVSIGHSITDWRDPMTAADVRAQRVLVGSLDLDIRRLPGSHPLWKEVKEQLHYYRLPAPALRFTPSFKVVRWYQ